MSRSRIIAKVRKNKCYRDYVRLLDDLGLLHELHPPTGKGHPFMLIHDPQNPDAEPVKFHVACTPRRRVASTYMVTVLRQKLDAAGFIRHDQFTPSPD